MRSAPLYVVSGGTGFSGEHLAQSVAAQFEGVDVPVLVRNLVRRRVQVDRIVREAAKSGGTILHTLVSPKLRVHLVTTAADAGVFEIDAMGDLLQRLSDLTGREPVGRPGLYRLLHQDYFGRVDAIDFAMAHDDGKRPEGLPKAEVVLVGVSRAGKTPLSMYLAVLGWRVANVPLVPGVPPPDTLAGLDRRRVFGLVLEPDELLEHRRHRQRRLDRGAIGAYTDPAAVCEEIDAARRFIRRSGFTTIDVSDKPVESMAEEIIEVLTRRFGADARRGG